MKRKITLITVLFIVFLLCLWEAFAAAIPGPELHLTTSRITVTISWTEAENADGYIFYFAPYPSAYPIWQLDVGPQTGPFVLELWPEAAFYIAVQAYGPQGPGEYSNIESFTLPSFGPLHRDDVAPDCLDGCHAACTGQGGDFTQCWIECEYECGKRPYVIIEKTFYSYDQSSGCSAEIDAKAKIYMLLTPTAVEDYFTVDFTELHSLSISGIQTFPTEVIYCKGSPGELIPPTGSLLRVNADRENGILIDSSIPPVGIKAILCCGGECGEWGTLAGVERMFIQLLGGQHTENVSPEIIEEFWEINLPVQDTICRITYSWALHTPE